MVGAPNPRSSDIAPAVNSAARFERVRLDEQSWVDVARGWIVAADTLFTQVRDGTQWRQGTMWRYEQYVTEPRLTSFVGRGRPMPFPALLDGYKDLRRRYGVDFDGFGMSYYRNGADAVGAHRDREMRWLDETVIAIVSLGAKRPFVVAPRHVSRRRRLLDAETGALDFAPASGDLLVLGGRAQADYLHAVPRVPGLLTGRISVQWRWTARTGRPEQDPGYGAPRVFTSGR